MRWDTLLKQLRILLKKIFQFERTPGGAVPEGGPVSPPVADDSSLPPSPPSKTGFPVFAYFVRPDIAAPTLAELKKHNITDVFLKCSRLPSANSYVGKILPQYIKMYEGVRVHAWLLCMVDANGEWVLPTSAGFETVKKEIKDAVNVCNSTDGLAGVCLDMVRFPGNANGNHQVVTDFVRSIRELLPNKQLTACIMPEKEVKYYYGQDPATLSVICDYLLPMIYRGSGFYNQPSNWIKEMTGWFNTVAPNKIVTTLITYSSDKNPVMFSNSDLQLDITNATLGGSKGFALFRFGLSNYVKPGITPTPSPEPTPPASCSLQDRIIAGTGRKFSTFTEFYNIVRETCKYAWYFDDQFNPSDEEKHLIQDINGVDNGFNCCDWVGISSLLAKCMGYGREHYGFRCHQDQIWHAVFRITGKEFEGKTCVVNGKTLPGVIIDCAAASSDNYEIGRFWCDNNNAVIEPGWLPYEN